MLRRERNSQQPYSKYGDDYFLGDKYNKAIKDQVQRTKSVSNSAGSKAVKRRVRKQKSEDQYFYPCFVKQYIGTGINRKALVSFEGYGSEHDMEVPATEEYLTDIDVGPQGKMSCRIPFLFVPSFLM
jgi:hypothetical protein